MKERLLFLVHTLFPSLDNYLKVAGLGEPRVVRADELQSILRPPHEVKGSRNLRISPALINLLKNDSTIAMLSPVSISSFIFFLSFFFRLIVSNMIDKGLKINNLFKN